ncbi:hypothetical protein ES703_24871 [subsurface metagenome]
MVFNRKKYSKKYYQKNKKRIIEQTKKYHKKFRANNRGHLREYSRSYKKKNPDKIKAINKKYNAKESVKARKKEWDQKNRNRKTK